MSRVAIIAVHGVGHHQPRQSARACADMLALTSEFAPFVESPLRIPVEPVTAQAQANRDQHAAKMGSPLDAFDERPEFVRDPDKAQHPDPSIEYMREQLSRYTPEGDDCVYETVSVRSQHLQSGREVHVYDMYWTDLSRVDTKGLRMIGELYQLLFYVSGLGRHTLDFAMNRNRGALWEILAACQRYAERALVLWIPVLNLCALALAILIPAQLVARNQTYVTGLVIALVALGGLGAWAATRLLRPGKSWPWAFFGILILAAGVILFSMRNNEAALASSLVLLAWAVAGGAVILLMYVYDQRRPGALVVSLLCVGIVAVLLVWDLLTGVTARFDKLALIGLSSGGKVYVALHVVWSLFVILALAVTIVGFIANVRSGDPWNARTVWTANLSLAVPGMFVLVLNLGLWKGLLKFTSQWIDPYTADGIDTLINDATPWTLGLLMAVGILAALSIVWAIAPSLLGEIKAKFVAQKGDSKAYGKSLSEAFHWMRICGEGGRWSLVLVIPVSVLIAEHTHWVSQSLLDSMSSYSAEMTLWVGVALIAMITGPLKSVASGLRTAIDVAIDVANWLRLHPVLENPRAKIAARFTSLLSNILDYKAADGQGFDHIVVFCHSQGTVISSETLRYLCATGHPLAERIGPGSVPVTLFTMGCPLHQLYSQRFPLQYEWARNELVKPPPPRPNPDELHVREWINAYRTGDYVGRHLWWTDTAPNVWDANASQAVAGGKCVDVCIGAGGHTHYWDDSAPQISKELAKLVR